MSPDLRAAADGFVYDVAMCIYAAEVLDAGGLELECKATGWTLHQTLEHLTSNYERYAGALERRLAGGEVFPEGAPGQRPAPPRDGLDGPHVLIARLQAARRSILASLEAVTPGQEASPLAPGRLPLGKAVAGWSAHGTTHAIDFIEARFEFSADPLVMEWAFYPRIGEDDALRDRRRDVLKRIRAAEKNK